MKHNNNKHPLSPVEMDMYIQIQEVGPRAVNLIDLVDTNSQMPELLFDQLLTALVRKGFVDIAIFNGATHLMCSNLAILVRQRSMWNAALTYFQGRVQ